MASLITALGRRRCISIGPDHRANGQYGTRQHTLDAADVIT